MPDRRRRPKHESRHRWLISYADMVTLLFCLFLVLFSYAASRAQTNELQGAVSGQLGSLSRPSPTPVPSASPNWEPVPRAADPTPTPCYGPQVPADVPSADPRQELLNRLRGSLLSRWGGLAEVRLEERGVVVALADGPMLFGSGSVELRPEGRRLLHELALAALPFGGEIRVEGHTDDVPVGKSGYRSNWQLSVMRAAAVVECLIGEGLRPERLSAMGYGPYRPRVPNKGAHERALNRRVELCFSLTEAREAQTTPGVMHLR